MRAPTIIGMGFLLAWCAACGGRGGGGAPDGGSTPDAPAADAGAAGPGYFETVAPLLNAHCLTCHVKGGLGPFPLDTYADAVREADRMRTATANRVMPPWPPGNRDSCLKFKDALWLRDDEIAAIAAWIDGGKQMGDPASAPMVLPPQPGLPTSNGKLDMEVDYRPSEAKDDDYRCFVVDPKLSRDMFLRAYEVKPGQRRMVHHIVLYALDTASAEASVQKRDDAEAGPGYTCFGGPGITATRLVGGWAPGTTVTHYPEGTGVRLRAGRKLVMQLHYYTAGGVSPDRTSIDLDLAEAVGSEAEIAFYGAWDLMLPPGLPDATVQKTFSNSRSLRLWGALPHMHRLGRTIGLEHIRDGRASCLMDVPRWDFNWQQFYLYDKPVDLEPGDQWRMTCSYDTTTRTGPVFWGEGTDDEMCLFALYLTKR